MYGPAAFRDRDCAWVAEVADIYPACLIGSRAVTLMGMRTHRWSHKRTGWRATIWVTRLSIRSSIRSMHSPRTRVGFRLLLPSLRDGSNRRSSLCAGCSTRSAPACWPGLLPACCDAAEELRALDARPAKLSKAIDFWH